VSKDLKIARLPMRASEVCHVNATVVVRTPFYLTRDDSFRQQFLIQAIRFDSQFLMEFDIVSVPGWTKH
jgi:hypothetical protein